MRVSPPGGLGVLLLVLASTGCGGGGDAGGDGGPGGPRGAADPQAQAAVQGSHASRYLGILTVVGRPELAICDGRSMAVGGPALPDLVELHAALTPGVEPVEGIFVDFLGALREEDGEPWLDALEVRRAAYEGWGCLRDESRLSWEASGTEPFWSLSVEEGVAIWRTPEVVQQFVHDGAFSMPRGGWVLEGRWADGAPGVRAEFYPETCWDAMSGAYSHLSVSVELDGTRYQGCGFQGAGAEPGG